MGVYRDVGTSASAFRSSGNIRPVLNPIPVIAAFLGDVSRTISLDPELEGDESLDDARVGLGKPGGTGVAASKNVEHRRAGMGDRNRFIAGSAD
jgi:hypothetical protein